MFRRASKIETIKYIIITKFVTASATVNAQEGSGDAEVEVDFNPTQPPTQSPQSSSYLRIEKLNTIDSCDVRTRPGDKLSVFYIGKFENGEIFDFKTKKRRSDKGFTFTLGARQVIQGWDIVSVDVLIGQYLLDKCKGIFSGGELRVLMITLVESNAKM